MGTESLAEYIQKTNLGFAVLKGADLKSATVEDITVNQSFYHPPSYEANKLIKCCGETDLRGLLIISTCDSKGMTSEEYSVSDVAAHIAAKAGKKGIDVIRVIKKEGLVEQYTVVPIGNRCKSLDVKRDTLEEFMRCCALGN